jgi:hypothetical protein
MVEHLAVNEGVTGSNPVGGAILCDTDQKMRHAKVGWRMQKISKED